MPLQHCPFVLVAACYSQHATCGNLIFFAAVRMTYTHSFNNGWQRAPIAPSNINMAPRPFIISTYLWWQRIRLMQPVHTWLALLAAAGLPWLIAESTAVSRLCTRPLAAHLDAAVAALQWPARAGINNVVC